MQARRLLIGYIFYISLSVGIVVIYGFQYLQNLWFPLLGYYIFTYLIHIIWSKIRAKNTIDLFSYFILFLYKSALYLSLVALCIGGFLFYQNNIFPAKLPTYTLSNGVQNIVFQTMSHVGDEKFYTTVVEKVYQNKKKGAVLYYEGVLPGNEQNTKDFSAALGIDLSPGLYDNFSKLYGLQAQDNNDFLGLVNNKDYNIDIDLDTVMNLYRQKIGTGSQNTGGMLATQEVQDINQEVIEKLSQLSEKELLILRYINQGIFNFMLKHEGLRNIIIEKLANQDIFSVILDDRNKHLAGEILLRKDEKIIILYGLMHFQGVLELLQTQDENWEITETQYTQIINQN